MQESCRFFTKVLKIELRPNLGDSDLSDNEKLTSLGALLRSVSLVFPSKPAKTFRIEEGRNS